MSTSHDVAQFLPYLRRYARALSGNQTAGDAYVAAALEALIRDPAVIEGAGKPRVALFRLFSKIWNSLSINNSTDAVDTRLPAERRLGHIHPLPRQAFLLVAVEGFSEADAAEVLDVDVPAL